VQLPTAPALPAGTVLLRAVAPAASGQQLVSRGIPLSLAPAIIGKLPAAAMLTKGVTSLQLECSPPVEPEQTVALIVGERVVPGVPGAPGSQPRSELDFELTNFVAGTYPLRLRVDGQDSIPVTTDSLTFDDKQRVELSL